MAAELVEERGRGPRAEAAAPLLELQGIRKSFPGCLANDDVSLAVEPGEIHALLGENGAGKSTLVKIIYGVLHADAGTIRWQGRPVRIANPGAARRLGIGMVFQHFSLFDALSVTENVALGIGGGETLRQLRGRIEAVSESYGLALHPDRSVHDLSVGERQRVEIVRCLLQNPRLIIMDEPTSVLTPQEVERLFATLRRLAREGCAILYISHKLEEIKTLCERATIMRQGRVVATMDPRQETARRLAEIMIGEELRQARPAARRQETSARFEVSGLSLRSDQKFGTDLKDIALSVVGGEILGIAGVAGNGQTELMEALSGEMLSDAPERVRIDGRAAGRLSASGRRRLGAAFVPEERNGHGAVPGLSLAENALLSSHGQPGMVRAGFLDGAAARAFASQIIATFKVRCSGPEAEARSLSGGNLQKFIVGREILRQPGVLVVSQPTWGVDAGAAAAIHQALLDLAAKGAAVLLISQDLDEILALADRIAVLSSGRLSRARPSGEVTAEEIGLLMGGIQGLDGQEVGHGAQA